MISDTILDEIKSIIENGEDVSPKVARRLLLMISSATFEQLLVMNGRVKKVEAATETLDKVHKKYPSLLWLLRHKTKITVVVIVIMFCALSILWIPEFREIILEYLNLPPLFP